jgi:micrococcal nuclease
MIKKVIKWVAVLFIGFFAMMVALAGLIPQSATTEIAPTHQIASSTSDTTSMEASSSTEIRASPERRSDKSTKTTSATSSYIFYDVVKVVDGDTIEINFDGTIETIRLIGINTPETVDPRKPVQCFGKEASNEAKTLLSAKRVRLEMDNSQGKRDKYGRLLAYVFRQDGLFFNEEMIKDGYAYEYTYNLPYKYQTQFKADQEAAKAAQKGLWSPNTCNGDLTSNASDTAPTLPSRNGHTFYLSTYHTAKTYYCDTDETWKSLSTNYLKSYDSEQAVLQAYPNRVLHEACK